MLRVGLTGALASGKSTVAEMFAGHGVRVLRADELAHELMLPGRQVYQDVVKHFGADILQANGAIVRAKLAAKAFGEGRVEELNRLVHPAVIAEQEKWMRELSASEPRAIAMIEAALLLEAGVRGRFDKMIVVTCPAEERVQRFAQRTRLPLDEARAEFARRMTAQMPEEEKVEAADLVINNSGTPAQTAQQVAKIYDELRAPTPAKT